VLAVAVAAVIITVAAMLDQEPVALEFWALARTALPAVMVAVAAAAQAEAAVQEADIVDLQHLEHTVAALAETIAQIPNQMLLVRLAPCA